MPGSTVPAVLTNLETLLGAAPDLSGVQIIFVDPEYIDLEEAEAVGILIPQSVASEEEILDGTPGTQTERYQVPLRIKVWDADGTPRDVMARMFQIYDAVRAVVADNPTLNGALTSGWASIRLADTQGGRAQGDRAVRPAVDANGNRAGYVGFVDVDIEAHDLIYSE